MSHTSSSSATPLPPPPHPVILAGCGPGAPEYVTPVARNAALTAELLVGAPRLLALFPEATGQRVDVQDRMAPALDAAEAAWRAGKRVTLLVTGDPGLFSLASLAIKRFGPQACRVIPGISSVQVACARLGVAWSRAHLVSAHAQLPADATTATLAQHEVIIILGGNDASWDWINTTVTALAGTHAAWLCENLTLPDERVLPWPATHTPNTVALVVLTQRGEYSAAT